MKKEIKKNKKEVCEVFEVEKNVKEEVVKTCESEPEEEQTSKKQMKTENRILTIFLIIIVIAVISFIVALVIINSYKNFEYNGISFSKQKEGQITFYHTTLPLSKNGKKVADFNIFLRKDPRIIGGKILFNGSVSLTEMMVLNSTENFNCNGDGVIAIANFQQIMDAFGTTIINDVNATCDRQGRYMFVNILKGNETKIEQSGSKCYNFYVNNCEILEVSERFLLNLLEWANS